MLTGKVAATRSTSGIGLGTAVAPAEQGGALVLNGFGDAAVIDGIKRDLVARHGVKIGYSSADMSEPAEVRQMTADATRELVRSTYSSTGEAVPMDGGWRAQ